MIHLFLVIASSQTFFNWFKSCGRTYVCGTKLKSFKNKQRKKCFIYLLKQLNYIIFVHLPCIIELITLDQTYLLSMGNSHFAKVSPKFVFPANMKSSGKMIYLNKKNILLPAPFQISIPLKGTHDIQG